MAVDYFDGFDEYSTTQISRYWTGMSSSAEMCAGGAFDSNFLTTTSGGRNSSGSIKGNGSNRSANKTLLAQATRAMGVAAKFASFSATNGIMAFGDAATSQVTLTANTDGTLSVKRGTASGTVLGTTTLSLTSGVWYYIEFKATINNTTGSFTVNVNGAQWLTASSQNTRSTANNSANQIAIGNTGTPVVEFDDFYSEDAGNFLGDCRVETKLPTGNGTSSQFTPSAGTNWQNVDENPATDDTDYNSDGTAGHIDGYTYPALTTTAGNIKAVMTVPILRNDAAGSVTAASLYRSGGTNYFGTTNTVGSTTYTSYIDIQATDPNTSAAWTVANVNACEFGIKRVA